MRFVLLFAACMAYGCGSIQQHMWLYGTPVKLVNGTDRYALFQVGLREVNVPPAEERITTMNQGFFLAYSYSTELMVTARVCKEVRLVPAFVVPSWAANTRFLRGWAITERYLEKNPSESELEERVRLILGYLDETEQLGREQMKHELRGWFRSVRRAGFAVRPECVGSIVAPGLPLHTYNDNYHNRIITVYLRGSPGEGYRISQQ